MSDIKLFRLENDQASEIPGSASNLEKDLQTLIEKNLDPLLGIRFLATEYPTGKTHGGRIDTLGLDENHCPVILEYKRATGENVINQGLFYLDWLMDHQAEFKLLVMDLFGKEAADAIDWSSPRLLCIAADFTKYDGHAVQQINRNIELIRYRKFGSDLLLLELVNAVSAASSGSRDKTIPSSKKGQSDKTVTEWLDDLSPELTTVFEAFNTHLAALGDDVQRKDLKLYVAYKRLRNFVTVVFQKQRLRVFLHLDPDVEEGLHGIDMRDVREVGHWGTGDVEISISSLDDLAKAQTILQAAYEGGKK